MTASPPRRALSGLLGTDRSHLTEPPARDGYSAARRALAGLLGVRLVTPAEQPGPIPPATSTSPREDRHISAAAAIAAADPMARLIVRQSPLAVAVPLADLLVRAMDIAHSLASSGGRVEHSDLARARTLSHGLALALARDLDLDLEPILDLDLEPILDRNLDSALDLARALDRALDLDLDLDRALDRDLEPILDRNLDRARALDRALARAFVRALDLVRILDGDLDPDLAHARARPLVRALDLAREIASVLARALSDSLGIEHLDGLADALLNGALDDFSQADLSAVDLSHFGLVGVRWSVSGTRWPPGVDVDALLRRSKETAPGSGIYVITRPGETEMADTEARV